jgi:hypothetical protein
MLMIDIILVFDRWPARADQQMYRVISQVTRDVTFGPDDIVADGQTITFAFLT